MILIFLFTFVLEMNNIRTYEINIVNRKDKFIGERSDKFAEKQWGLTNGVIKIGNKLRL